MESYLWTLHLSDNDRQLLRMFGSDIVPPEDIRRFFEQFSFEDANAQNACMLAKLCSRNDAEGVPEALLPRVRGILRHTMTNTICQLRCMYTLIGAYNRAGIPVMVLKGAAMKAVYFPEYIRPMWDTDILVRRSDYRRAVEIARQAGFDGEEQAHSCDLKRGPLESIDLHHAFLRGSSFFLDSDIWPEGVEAERMGAVFQVPTREALLVQMLETSFMNFIESRPNKPAVKWAFDIYTFLHRNSGAAIDWRKIAALAKSWGVTAQVRAALNAFDHLMPGHFDAAGVLPLFGPRRRERFYWKMVARYQSTLAELCKAREHTSHLRMLRLYISRTWCRGWAISPGGFFHTLGCMPRTLMNLLELDSRRAIPAAVLRKMRKRAWGK